MYKRLLLIVLAWVFITATHSWAYTWDGFDLHGFFDQGYIASTQNNYYTDTKDGSFHMVDAALNVRKQLNDQLSFGAQAYTYRYGDMGSFNTPLLDWAYMDYQAQSWLGFKAGKIKSPLGLYGDSWDLEVTRPYVFLPTGTYAPYERELLYAILGGCVYGDIPLNRMGSLDYVVAFGTADVPTHSAFNWYISQSSPYDVDHSNNSFVLDAQLTWNTPVHGLKTEASMQYARNVRIDGRFKTSGELSILPEPLSGMSSLGLVLGGSDVSIEAPDVFLWNLGAEYMWKEWTFATEYQLERLLEYAWVDNPAAYNMPVFNGTTPLGTTTDAWYFAVSRRISDKLDLGAYYSLQFPNMHDRTGSLLASEGGSNYGAFTKDLALVACYRIKPWWLLKAEAHLVNGTSEIINYSDNQPISGEKRYWLMGVLQTSIFF
jgi:hypothetical protein